MHIIEVSGFLTLSNAQGHIMQVRFGRKYVFWQQQKEDSVLPAFFDDVVNVVLNASQNDVICRLHGRVTAVSINAELQTTSHHLKHFN